MLEFERIRNLTRLHIILLFVVFDVFLNTRPRGRGCQELAAESGLANESNTTSKPLFQSDLNIPNP